MLIVIQDSVVTHITCGSGYMVAELSISFSPVICVIARYFIAIAYVVSTDMCLAHSPM